MNPTLQIKMVSVNDQKPLPNKKVVVCFFDGDKRIVRTTKTIKDDDEICFQIGSTVYSCKDFDPSEYDEWDWKLDCFWSYVHDIALV